MTRVNKLLRYKPIPCKVCGNLFSGRSYRRYNCDLHYRQLTPEVKTATANKIRAKKTGIKRKPFDKQWIERMRASAQHGAKCHRWKGGITPINEKIRKSSEYVAWRKEVFLRDDYTCQFCGKRGRGTIHADHIAPFALFPELRFSLDNGRTLCIDCHRKTPTYGDLSNYKHVFTK